MRIVKKIRHLSFLIGLKNRIPVECRLSPERGINMRNLVIDTTSNPGDAANIQQRLREYNAKYLSEKDMAFVEEAFCFRITDEDGNILGGISGTSKMQCLLIQFLWVDESIRGQGFGKKLMERAEKFAVEKKCRMIKVDTFSFQAPDFYRSLGYEIYGQIDNFPEGYHHYFLLKKL